MEEQKDDKEGCCWSVCIRNYEAWTWKSAWQKLFGKTFYTERGGGADDSPGEDKREDNVLPN